VSPKVLEFDEDATAVTVASKYPEFSASAVILKT
jgi:hypothetical protein